jgi:hypothetical protein
LRHLHRRLRPPPAAAHSTPGRVKIIVEEVICVAARAKPGASAAAVATFPAVPAVGSTATAAATAGGYDKRSGGGGGDDGNGCDEVLNGVVQGAVPLAVQ